jgi:hypothetical protein
MSDAFTITIPERQGVCRWCGCTDAHGCDEGCTWANARHTLCTSCVNLDRDMRNPRGRRHVADVYRTNELMSTSVRTRRK